MVHPMFGLRVTINQDAFVVAAAEDASQVIAMLTATGVLGPSTRPSGAGETHECWLSVRSTCQVAGAGNRVPWIRRYGLGIGDQVTIEIVETDHATAPLAETGDRPNEAVSPTQMLGFMVTVNDEPPVTGAAHDLYVLTAVVGVSGVLGRIARPARLDQTQDYRLFLGGLTARRAGDSDEHLHWLNREDLAVGDRVTIQIVQATSPSVPEERMPAE